MKLSHPLIILMIAYTMARKTRQEFIEDARKVWGNQYDYSQVDYVNSKTKVLIRCIKHDETFLQTPYAHNIMKRQGCPSAKKTVRKARSIKNNYLLSSMTTILKNGIMKKTKIIIQIP